VLGFRPSVPVTLAGWLWADILLGLLVIFLAANSVSAPVVGAPQPTARPGVDPKPVELVIQVNGAALLGGDTRAIETEQTRIVGEVQRQLLAKGEQRRVAVVLAYGAHEQPADGDKLARLATGALRTGPFAEAAVKTHHDLVPGDRGTRLVLELYLFQ
jgi:Flp pilus assembly protein TadD